ncbi:MAG: hypothetical protein ACFFCZ_08490 [Promethearchaeota archaeon]
MAIINYELVPSKSRQMAWITQIFNQGIRRPGYPADYWAENWVKEQFQSFGLENVKLDPVSVKKWEAETGTLKIWSSNQPDKILVMPCFPLPYSTPTDGIEAELCLTSDNNNLSGKIAVYNLELIDLPTSLLKALADRYYDPRNEFDTLNQLMPFGISIQDAMGSAIEANASAFIGILSNYPWETHDYYVPYDAKERKLPGVWVSPNNGEKIMQLMADGTVMGKLSYTGKISDAISHNITSTLPGMSDEWIIIGTHHDGPWSSAVEDGSGMALVLAQAEYWSQIPKSQRPFNLMFLMNCAHMAGGMGSWTFIKSNKEFLQKVVTAIHLEHVACDIKSENGKLTPLDTPVVRWWFTSRINSLEKIVEDAIIKEDLYRSIIMPPDGFPPGTEFPPTDGGPYHTMAVPLISLLAAPPYLFDSTDILDKIHQESLEPITRAIIRIINGLKNQSADGLRTQVRGKDEFSEQVEQYAEKLQKKD